MIPQLDPTKKYVANASKLLMTQAKDVTGMQNRHLLDTKDVLQTITVSHNFASHSDYF